MTSINKTGRDKIFNIINMIFVTLIMVIVLYPLIYIISSSFSDPDLVSTGKVWLFPKGFNIEGYRRVFRDSEIMIGYRNTLFYTIAGTLLNLACTLPAAYALSRRDLVGKNIIMFLMLFTMYFSGGMIPTYLIVKSLGLFNKWCVLLVTSAVNTYNLIISRTFFANGVPGELEEAAIIDGCSKSGVFFMVVLPLSKALIGVLTLYYGVAHWNSWFDGLIYLTDRSKVPLQLVLREILIEQQMKSAMVASGQDLMGEDMQALQVKLASLIRYCVIVISSVPVMAAYPFLQKYFDKGVMLGSLKG
ncbi:MAG: carbohydrate ABC transporter permease [Clostridiaceae bacterium]